MTNKASQIDNPLAEDCETVHHTVENAVDNLDNIEFYKDDQVHPTMIAEATPQIRENIFSTETPTIGPRGAKPVGRPSGS
mmetsp:Transcript_33591/g.51690  ORF Transcript_33591/g.51690 Transcript_33591/m.51690 type:complete len:80 (+) Transcript_33591:469-708(+)